MLPSVFWFAVLMGMGFFVFALVLFWFVVAWPVREPKE